MLWRDERPARKHPEEENGIPLMRGRKFEIGGITAALLLAVVVRLLWVDGKPLWNDEAFSIRVALLPTVDVVSTIGDDVHPPLYYLLLHIWLQFFPADEASRYLSVLAGAVAMPVVYLFARRIVTRSQATVAVVICAIVPFYVSWSQISRGYAVLLLVCLVALLAAGHVLSFLDNAGKGERAAGRLRNAPPDASLWRWCAIYAVAGAAALWTHNVGAFLLLGINAAAGWRVLTGQLWGIRPLLIWSVCQIGIIALWSPWVPTVLEQSSRFSSDHFVVTIAGVIERIATLFGAFMLWKLGTVVAVVGVIGAMLGALRLDRRSADVQLAMAGIIVPVTACLLLFLAGKPAFGYSVANLVWIPALVAILLAANLRQPRRGQFVGAAIGAALVLGFVLLSVRGLQNWYAAPNPAWDRVAAYLAQQARPGDAIIATTDLSAVPDVRQDVPMHALVVYWAKQRSVTAQLPLPIRPPAGDEAELLQWMARYERLWVPRFAAMPPETPSMRLIALAERHPDRWSVTHETIQRLAVTRITGVVGGN